MGPLEVVAQALEGTSAMFEERRPFAKARPAIIATHPALQERELIKLASLATAMAGALRKRGTRKPAATLAAETGIAIFKLAFERWVNDSQKKDLAHHLREALEQLRVVTAGRRASTPTPAPKHARR